MPDFNPEAQDDTQAAPHPQKKPLSTAKIVLIVLAAICCCGGVPVVGIIAAIAIPAYSDYSIRSNISDIQAALETEKVPLEAQFNQAKNCDINPSISNKNIESVTFSPIQNAESIEGCQITTSFNLPALKNTRLIYTLAAEDDGTAKWSCHIIAAPKQYKYFSPNCRNQADENMLENRTDKPTASE